MAQHRSPQYLCLSGIRRSPKYPVNLSKLVRQVRRAGIPAWSDRTGLLNNASSHYEEMIIHHGDAFIPRKRSQPEDRREWCLPKSIFTAHACCTARPGEELGQDERLSVIALNRSPLLWSRLEAISWTLQVYR